MIGAQSISPELQRDPGVIHLVAENASDVEPARILAVFVADEGATLTTYLE
jgi:hypothetical protein